MSTVRAAEAETGPRQPAGPWAWLIAGLALAWSLFQLWYASPLAYSLGIGVFDSTEARAIHLSFALALAYLAWPMWRGTTQGRGVPWYDVGLALVAAFCAGYLFWFQDQLAGRPGSPTPIDIGVAAAGMVLLLEAARRTLGLPLTVVALVFLAYTFFGSSSLLPDTIQWKGASIARAMSHQWLTTEGVFGVALGVSTGFVFLFVLFGSLLERAGAGAWFIRLAFSLLGAMRGGPAKAAVVASGMTGIVSGSSIANVVTTGTFTIPLMRRVGFARNKAGAIEVASSVNGQLMPPVMGAAAFLMVEYVGIGYVDVIRHALLPALISYIALLYMVHLEAVKADMQGLPRRNPRPWLLRLLAWGLVTCSIILLAGAVYYGIGWIRALAGEYATPVILTASALVYVGLLWIVARTPGDTERIDEEMLTELPAPGATLRSGLHYLLPLVVLIWFLLVERRSPGASAFSATLVLIAILLTQRPLLALMRRRGDIAASVLDGGRDLVEGLIVGARNMIGIGVATATAGIIVGTVTLTGIGQVMTQFVELLSGGHLLPMLMLTALICIILGMGLPTTANYIVVSSLMAPVIVTLAGEHGLIVPLIAVHLFVFYFGIMADVTPPVGLAAYAAAAISRGDPIRTGVHAFWYSLRMAVLPFLFVFNTELLLIGVSGPLHGLAVAVLATIGMLLLASGLQGWFVTRLRPVETAVLLLAAFTFLYPGFWMDRIVPPRADLPASEFRERVVDAPAGAELQVIMEREDFAGEEREVLATLDLGPAGEFEQRLRQAGLILPQATTEGWRVEPQFGHALDDPRYTPDIRITAIRVQRQQPPAEWFLLPAGVLVLGVGALQWRRRPAGGRNGPPG